MLHNKLLLIGLFLLMRLPINAMTVSDMRQAIQDGDINKLRHILDRRLQVESNFRVGRLLPWAETVEMATVLIDEYGADVNEKIKFKREAELDEFVTSLHMVKTKEIALLLLDCGAEINARSSRVNATPLHEACNMEVMEALLERGADPNLQDDRGNTPLTNLNLSNSNDMDRAILLLSYGAYPAMQNNLGFNPRQVAENEDDGNSEMAELFKQRQMLILSRLRATKHAPNVTILLRNREIYGTFRSPY